MRKRLAAGIAVGLVAVLLLAAGGGWLYWSRWAARAVGGPKKTVRVTIPEGASAAAVAADLEAKGLLRSAAFFGRLAGESGKAIRPGVYDLATDETPARILRRLRQGDVATTRVTFPEGFTAMQMARRLRREGLIADEEGFRRLVMERGNTLGASFAAPANLEGYLFPDTYRFPIGATETEIARQMLGNFERLVVRGEEDSLKAAGRPLADIVNVAAMVEREAETDADRPKIAGVIYNRIARNMRLEIDATVQYANVVAGIGHKSRLLFRDLKIDSPYNTYRVAGLPAGPICNPGLKSIEAALRPEPSEYLFYVARPDGSHIFGRTFADHQRNIAEARRLAREARRADGQ